jgi:hypothetical protein
MAAISLRLTARQWATVDATMDNLASNARSSGEDDQPALRIREAGRAQVPWVSAAKEWPADDEVLTITLRRDQWGLAVRQLQQDHGVYQKLGDRQSLELGLNAERAIRRQLP